MKKSLLKLFITAILLVGFSTITNAQNLFLEDFETTSGNYTDIEEDLTNWTTDSLVGDRNWYSLSYNDNLYAQMNSYNSGGRNNSWLISPAIDLSGATQKRLRFDVNVGYFDHDGLKIYLSTDFDGSDISSATWIDSTAHFNIPESPSDGYGTLSSAGSIDLSDYSGTIYIAFQYVGNDTSATDSATTYQIDNVNIYDPTYPTISEVDHNPKNPTTDDKVGISANVESAVGIDSVFFVYGNTPETMADTIGMVLESGSTYVGLDSIPAQADGDTTFYQVTGINANDDSTASSVYNYVTSNIEVLTIYDIQYTTEDTSDYYQKKVQTTGIVTANYEDGFYMQDGKGPWNGILVYDDALNPSIGDSVKIIGTVDEYYGKTELKPLSSLDNSYQVLSTGNTVPAPDTITTGEANSEKYESVLIRVEEVKCTSEPNNYNEWLVYNSGDTLIVNDLIYLYENVVKDYEYSITGVVDYDFGAYRILPRKEADVELLTNALPTITNVQMNPSSGITSDDEVQVTAVVTDQDTDQTLSVNLIYGTASDAINDTVDFTTEGTTSEDEYGGTIPAQSGGATVYFEIHASDGDTTIVYEGNYEVEEDVTGINDLTDFEMNIYPNPGFGQYNIEFNANESGLNKIDVYNAIGNLVHQKVINNPSQGRTTLNINQLSDGVYYVKLSGGNVEKVVKVIKQ